MTNSSDEKHLEAIGNHDMRCLFERLLQFFGDCKSSRCVLLALGLVLLPRFGAAQQLQWESEELTFEASPTDTAVVAHFKFKNIGNAEAKIASVNSSCSCTTLALTKKNFALGESSDLTATFTIGARTGVQKKVIMVESNDLKRPTTILRMNVTIPEAVRLRPTFLYWTSAEPLSPKEIRLEIKKGFPATAIRVESSNPKISAKAEAVKAGEEYRIIVTPEETGQPVMAMLTIRTDYPPENPKTFYAHVRVQPKK